MVTLTAFSFSSASSRSYVIFEGIAQRTTPLCTFVSPKVYFMNL